MLALAMLDKDGGKTVNFMFGSAASGVKTVWLTPQAPNPRLGGYGSAAERSDW